LSQFISKVLDQLSLSAWLPAAMLVGCGAILVQLHAQRDLDLGAALIELTAKPLGILIVLLFALVLAAMICQAFSFGAIRALEGYWGGPRLTALPFGVLVRRQVRRRCALTTRLCLVEKRAFARAREGMLEGNIPRHIIDIREDQVYSREGEWTSAQLEEAAEIEWHDYCPADHLEKISYLVRRLHEFPEPSRLLPTKLGNILRATEDGLSEDDGSMEGWSLRRLEMIPPRLRQRHDEFRTRLDMYCTLVFGCFLLAGLAAALLYPAAQSPVGVSAVVVMFLFLAGISNSAAIASARGYCTVLDAMDAMDARPKAGQTATVV
jgi:hypothetical protein